MKESQTHRIIKAFFGKHFSKDAQMHFRFWFLNSKDSEGRDESVREMWNNCESVVTDSTWKDLTELRSRIDNESSNHRQANKFWWMAAAAVLLIFSSVIIMKLANKANLKATEPNMLECYVPLGENRSITLPDSSKIFLNAGSLLIYPESFNSDVRKVFLIGEARVMVAKDPEKPFIVSTHNMDVEALGTIFNVSDYQLSHIAASTLEEGSVRVLVKTVNTIPAILKPGQQLVYDSAAKSIMIREVDAVKTSSWINGYIVFDNAPFEEVIRALERRFDVTINYNADKYYGHSYCVKFSPDETLEDAMEILSQLIDGFDYTMNNHIINIR